MSRRAQQTVHLGFELGSGEPVRVPLAHTFVTGQTQLSGKTTTLAALVARSSRRALAFVTKRGEEFHRHEGLGVRRVRPYLPREGDQPIHWRLVETILASALGQRAMKYERYWIVNAAKGARSLQQVRDNVERLRKKAKGSTAETYELIGEYLDLVLPEMRELNAADTLDLQAGLNVIDLIGHSQQLQELVIRACLERINQHEEKVLTVFPEAWKFAPRGRVTPSSAEAAKMAREGAGIGNLLLCDSQDIAGVDTVIRLGASVWILGVQRELNELRRALSMMPGGIKKPKPAEVTSLKLGQFIACWQDRAVRTYVQPAWMDEASARAVARGELAIEDVQRPDDAGALPRTPPIPSGPMLRSPGHYARKTELTPAGGVALGEVVRRGPARPVAVVDRQRQIAHESLAALNQTETANPQSEEDPMSKEDVEQITRSFKETVSELVSALRRDPQPAAANVGNDDAAGGSDNGAAADEPRGPARLTLETTAPELVVEVERRELTEDENGKRGRVAVLIAEGFFKNPRIGNDAYKELKSRGFDQVSTRIYEALESLVKDGFLIMGSGKTYQQHPLLKVMHKGEKTVTLTIHYK